MNLLKHFPRLAAAALFAATASTAVVVADATHAGAPVTAGVLASAPQQAEAAVIGVGVGFGHPAYRYGWRGNSWVRLGFYGGRPGWYPGGYYVGYGAPAYPYGYYYNRGYWAHPYYGYRGGYYGRGYGYRGYGAGYGHVGYYGGGTHVGVGFRF